MVSEPSSSSLPSENAADATPDQLTVNLQVVSPSVGVNRPLLFPGLPASTTIKQLKEKIRQTLPLRPADENQRLIHRGRALVRETDSLVDIFGADTLRTPDQQTIHLVIRDSHDSHTQTPASARGPSPVAPAQHPANAPRQHAHHPQPFGPQPPPGFTRRNPLQTAPGPFPQPRMPSPSPVHTAEQAAAFQQQHQPMTQWLTHLQREAMARVVSQNQRARAQVGLRGVGDTAGNGTHQGDNNGRASPAPAHTLYREVIGPNGQTYQFETVIRTSAPGQANGGGGMSPVDVQNIIRGADANQATLNMTNAMRRSASSASLHSLHNRSLNQPGVTTSIFSNSGSGRATPDPNAGSRSVSGGSHAVAPGLHSAQPRQGLEVFILNSPEGPRALLVNNTSSEIFYTPRLRTQASHPQLRYPSAYNNVIYENPFQAQVGHNNQIQIPQHHHQPQHAPAPQPQPPQQRPQPEQPPQAQVQGPVDAQNQPQLPVGGMMHPGNPPAAALPPLLLQVWPQLWLLFRLALFVWFFTSPNASWSRWLTIICVAVFIFVLSTGVLNGFADHAWRPLGRHLENLIPPLEQPNRQRNRNAGGQGGQDRQPDPADMAARLVAEHQHRESWLISQVRRLERAGLLFLASIAPGVAERHIAHLEAAARAERERAEAERREAERREAEAAAARAAAEDAENNGENDNNGESAGTEGEQANIQQSPPDQAQAQSGEQSAAARGGQDEGQRDLPAREPLIAM